MYSLNPLSGAGNPNPISQVRLLLQMKRPEQASEIVRETKSVESALLVAKHCTAVCTISCSVCSFWMYQSCCNCRWAIMPVVWSFCCSRNNQRRHTRWPGNAIKWMFMRVCWEMARLARNTYGLLDTGSLVQNGEKPGTTTSLATTTPRHWICT